MARFGTVGVQYFDNNGDPLSAGKLYFYDPGTTTPKDTYSDSALSSANANPVVLDANGRQPDIFFDGEAKVVLKTSADITIETRDPVGSSTTTGAFGDYSATATYDADDIVKASDDCYYVCLADATSGQNPTTTSGYWAQVFLPMAYDATYSFKSGQLVVVDNVLYISLADGHSGNTPASSPTQWRRLSRSLINAAVQTANFDAAAWSLYPCNTNGGAFTATLPASPAAGDTVGFTDYGGDWATNNLTIGRNSNKIMGDTSDLVCDLAYFNPTLRYIDSTKGWILI